MGASASSSEQGSPEQKEAESLAASLGALPMLKKAFSLLAAAADHHDPQTNSIPILSLQQLFTFKSHQKSNSGGGGLKNFDQLLTQLGPSIVDHFFLANANAHDHDHDKGDGISYVQFLRGYVKCCGRSSAASSLNNLFRILTAAVTRAGLPPKLVFESEDTDYKMTGSFTPHDILLFLSLSWLMSFDSKTQQQQQELPALPDLDHLLLSAVESCSEESNNEINNSFWNCDLDLDLQLSAGKVLLWALKTTPNLADCIAQFVHGRLQKSVEDKSEVVDPSSEADDSSSSSSSSNLLTKGMVWAISLTLTSTLRQEILKAFLPSSNNADDGNNYDRLIYRSSVHGKGMNRFWSNVEGYNGPTLIILAARFEEDDDDNDGVTSKRCIVGVLTNQGFENKDTYYGSQGSLYAISPAFHVFSSHGKDKNFVYTHLHPTGRVYEPHPKPVGIAFGGSIGGNERIFIDEDFAKVTFRHHAVDKTYQHGPLFPGQGFLAVEGVVSEVEVWGLGGSHARKFQNSFKQREELFTNQRRKVDLKTFGNWEDSPEKMMMDMISDPNHVRREER